MLDNLNSKQLKNLKTVRDKWINLARRTYKLPRNNERLVRLAHEFYKEFEITDKKPYFIVVNSPMELQIAANIWSEFGVCNQVGNRVWDQVWDQVCNQVGNQVCNQVGNQVCNQVWDQVRNQVRNQVWDQVWYQVWDQVRNQVGNRVWDQVWDQVCNQVGNQVCNQVGNQVRNQVEDQVWDQVRNQVRNQVWDQVKNQVRNRKLVYYYINNSNINYSSYWLSYYDYFGEYLRYKAKKKFNLFKKCIKEFGYFTLWFDNAIITCDYPDYIRTRKDGTSHSESKAAYEWSNGEKYFVLNGVSVPQWVVETHPDRLKVEDVLNLKNPDQRAEAIRKFGIERIAHKGKIKDSYKNYQNTWFSKSKYELIDMASVFKSLNYAPYLKMANQSAPGVWHMEGVHPSCKTLDEAIRWRLKIKDKNYKIMEIK